MSRLLGLDHGSRRIGVAVGDTETGLAFARPALRRRSLAADVATIEKIAESEAAREIVIGLPLLMDGAEGEQARAARAFGDALVATGLSVAYEDERLSSWEAGQRLAESGRRPARASGELDSAAARVILQQYLDARRSPGSHEETE